FGCKLPLILSSSSLSEMTLLVIFLASLAMTSAHWQTCECEWSKTQFTDPVFNCPLDNFCSDSLVPTSCGRFCHESGSLHTMPFYANDVDNIYKKFNCVGPYFDAKDYGSFFCAYSTPSKVLSSSNACKIPLFACEGCYQYKKLKYFDYNATLFQVLCETGVLQYTYSDNTTDEFNGRLFLNKSTCVLTGGNNASKTITSVSCKSKPNEIDACVVQGGSPAGITGHCKYGTCWLYCENRKQLSFQKYGKGSRINIDLLPCENGTSIYGEHEASNLQCN
ncbi:hypothetical protein PFISCL1PPCAC_18067, partial [Pristionchus fissidentatus]